MTYHDDTTVNCPGKPFPIFFEAIGEYHSSVLFEEFNEDLAFLLNRIFRRAHQIENLRKSFFRPVVRCKDVEGHLEYVFEKHVHVEVFNRKFLEFPWDKALGSGYWLLVLCLMQRIEMDLIVPRVNGDVFIRWKH